MEPALDLLHPRPAALAAGALLAPRDIHYFRDFGYRHTTIQHCPANAPGMRLYERHGFQTVGIYHEQGMLNGAWADVIVMEKILD